MSGMGGGRRTMEFCGSPGNGGALCTAFLGEFHGLHNIQNLLVGDD